MSQKRKQRLKHEPANEARFQTLLVEALGCLQRKEASQARGLLAQCLVIKPHHFDCRHLLGISHLQMGELEEAVAMVESALALHPGHAPALFNLGLALGQQGRHQAAVDAYGRALEANPQYVEAWNNRGNAHNQLAEYDSAIACFQRAIELDPGYAEAHYNLAVMHLEGVRYPLAIAGFRAALAVKADHTGAWTNLGNAQSALGQHHEALESYEHALRIDPAFSAAHYNGGLALRACGHLSEAIESFEKALRLDPAHQEGWCSLGVALHEHGDVSRAVACYDRSLSIDPAFAKAAWNKAQALLLMGQFSDGWRLFESRWRDDDFTSPNRGFEAPLWLGEFDLKGRSILLHAEQGMGDAIQFARYAQLVKDLGAASVLLEVPTPLVPLMKLAQGIDQVIPRGSVLPDFDCHCPLMSLPLALQQTRPWTPARGYISLADAYIKKQAERKAEPAAMRVGIVWSGAPTHSNDRYRSIPLPKWSRLLSIGSVEWISVNYRVSAEEGRLLETYRVQERGTQCADFLDLSAALQQLDLLITVDSAPAHLAGTIGIPVWTLLPSNPDYRWMLHRVDTPWYPTMRLIRQQRRGDWEAVFEELALNLRSLLDGKFL